MIKIVVLTLIAFLAGSFEPAFADEVYNFQFAPKPEATPAPKPVVAEAAKVPEPAPPAPLESGWSLGIGAAGRVITGAYEEHNAVAFVGDYRWSKYIGAEAQLLYGKGSDASYHISAAFGGRVTPFHIRLLDWDLLDGAVCAGFMNASTREEPNRTRVAVFIGYDIVLNIAERFALVYGEKHEEGDHDLFQGMLSGLYRF